MCHHKPDNNMRTCIFLLLSICLLGCNKIDKQTKEIRNAVEKQMRIYPQSTLRDLYKNFFQDRFGPGHIIADTASADAYLREELSMPEKLGGPLYEQTGYTGNFYRVNLSLIKDSIIPYNTFFNAFTRSANGVNRPSVDEWEKEWHQINAIIYDMKLPIGGYRQDSLKIDSLLKEGKYVMHHSQKYNDTYAPHYRLISKEIFEAELLPFIEQHNRTDKTEIQDSNSEKK